MPCETARRGAHGLAPALLLLLAFLVSCSSSGVSRLASVDADAALEFHGFAVEFAGHRSFSETQLIKVIEDQLDDYKARELRQAFVDDAAYVLENYYRANGFPFALVTYQVDETLAGHWLRFAIDEGPRVAVASLEFDGLLGVKRDEVRPFFRFPDGPGDFGDLFSSSALGSGVSELTELLLSRGYLDAEVDAKNLNFEADRTRVHIRVQVRAGPRYVVQGVLVEGVPEEESAVIGPLLEQSLGRPFTPRLAFEMRNRVLEWYGDRGHAEVRAEVERDLDPIGGRVLLRYQVTPGPRIQIADVRIEGNRKTRRSVIEGRLRLGPGDPFHRARMRASFARLYQTGLFERVSLELEEPEANQPDDLPPGVELRDMEVKLEELPSQELFLEPGYGSYEQLRARLGYRERNLFGTGRALRAEATAALRALRAELGVTDSRFLFESLSADFALRWNEREEPSFTRQEVGVAATFSWPLSRHIENTVAYQYKQSRIFDIQVIDQDAIAALETVDISSVRLSPRFDTRNDLFVPSDGSLARVGIEAGDAAIGSELDFLRLTAATSRYITLDSNSSTVLGASVEAGVVVPHGNSDAIPLQERYFLGGEGSVRAFREQELGPKDSGGNPIGGEAYTLVSVELRQRLTQKLQGAAFFDAGNVILDHNDWSSFEDFRWGVGVGLRYVLPVGPLRLDLGWNPEPQDDESDLVLHFALGLSF